MRARAPGKLVLTGSYAVLEGAPAIVVAVDRHAVADASRTADQPPPAEVRAALGEEAAPWLDVAMLNDASGRKLGLGSSAAAVVACLAARALVRGEDIRELPVRRGIFLAAREAHARVQRGGSGVDVAASVYGGALCYALRGAEASIRPVRLPPGLVLFAYASGQSARTSELRARVDAARRLHPERSSVVWAAMASAALQGADALDANDGLGYVRAARAYERVLAQLGELADAPIVPPEWRELSSIAGSEGAAFLPSGAGGGDVAVWLGLERPSPAFGLRAEARGLSPLALSVDQDGVCAEG